MRRIDPAPDIHLEFVNDTATIVDHIRDVYLLPVPVGWPKPVFMEDLAITHQVRKAD
ncbi:MAG: hypothetical protein AAGI36_13755 [Pseudomonadota bacterium]